MAYQLEGRLLEVCNCDVLCPCWVGEDPDGGTCDAIVAYHIDDGQIEAFALDDVRHQVGPRRLCLTGAAVVIFEQRVRRIFLHRLT